MRRVGGVLLGLIGVWLLYKAVTLARVLVAVDHIRGERYLAGAAIVVALIAAGLFFACWRLVRRPQP